MSTYLPKFRINRGEEIGNELFFQFPDLQFEPKTYLDTDHATGLTALSANGTAVYQLGGAVSTAGGVTESKIAVLPATVRVVLTYSGAGAGNAFDTTVDLDLRN